MSERSEEEDEEGSVVTLMEEDEPGDETAVLPGEGVVGAFAALLPLPPRRKKRPNWPPAPDDAPPGA